MTWLKLVDCHSRSIPLGATLRVPSARVYDGSWYAEPIMDFLVMDLGDTYETRGFGLLSKTGYKAGRIAATPPLQARAPNDAGISTNWLVRNWREWVYPDGDVEDVWINPVYARAEQSPWKEVDSQTATAGTALRMQKAVYGHSDDVVADDFFLFECGGSVTQSNFGVVALSGHSVGQVVALLPRAAEADPPLGLDVRWLINHSTEWLPDHSRASAVLLSSPYEVVNLPDGRPWVPKSLGRS